MTDEDGYDGSRSEGISDHSNEMHGAARSERLANFDKRLAAEKGKVTESAAQRFPEFIVGSNDNTFYQGLEDYKNQQERNGGGIAFNPTRIEGDILARRIDEDGSVVGYEPLNELRERSRREGSTEFENRLRAAGLPEMLADRPATGPAVLVNPPRQPGRFLAGEKFPPKESEPRIPLDIPRTCVFVKEAGGGYSSLLKAWPTKQNADDFAAGVLWQVHGMETPEFWVETAPGHFSSKQKYDRIARDPALSRGLPENPRLLICRPDADGPEIPFRVKQIAERRDPHDFKRIMRRAGMPESLGDQTYEVPPVLVLTPEGDLRAGETFPELPGGQRIPDDIPAERVFVQGVFADGTPTGTYGGISHGSRMPRLAHWVHPEALMQANIEDREVAPSAKPRSPAPGRPAGVEAVIIDLTEDDPPAPGSPQLAGRPARHAPAAARGLKLDADGDVVMLDAPPPHWPHAGIKRLRSPDRGSGNGESGRPTKRLRAGDGEAAPQPASNGSFVADQRGNVTDRSAPAKAALAYTARAPVAIDLTREDGPDAAAVTPAATAHAPVAEAPRGTKRAREWSPEDREVSRGLDKRQRMDRGLA